MSLAPSPKALSRRLFSSPAALFVKVIAIILQGSTGSRAAAFLLSSLSPASISAISSSLAQSGTSRESDALPYRIRFTILFIKTVVFPLPAPARSKRGPSVVITALRCSGLSLAKSASISFFLALIYLFSKLLSIIAPQTYLILGQYNT